MPGLSNIKFHYFPFPARGGFLRLLLDDAGLDYEVVDIRVRDWPQKKAQLIEEGIPAPSLPYLTIDGKYMGKTFPTMRYLSKELGNYSGKDDMENQYLDSLADISLDWFNKWALARYVTRTKEAEEKYQKTTGVTYHDTFENVFAKSGGPFVLGDKITYVDLIVYHCLVEDTFRQNINNENKYPYLKKFIEAIESRPALRGRLSKI